MVDAIIEIFDDVVFAFNRVAHSIADLCHIAWVKRRILYDLMELPFLLLVFLDAAFEALLEEVVMGVCVSLDFVCDLIELILQVLLLIVKLAELVVELLGVFLQFVNFIQQDLVLTLVVLQAHLMLLELF